MAGWPEEQVKSWVSGQVARSKGLFAQGETFCGLVFDFQKKKKKKQVRL